MEDIKLVSLTQDDIELVRQWRNSEDVSKYMYTSDVITADEQKVWFERVRNDDSQRYWIINYQERKLGVASLYAIKPRQKTCYWAFYLGDTSIRGAGIGSKVEYRVLEYVFDKMKYDKLLCEVFAFNGAVIRMHEKFGFRRESYFREHILKSEKRHDVVGLAMTRSEWLTVKDHMCSRIYR